jgi:hypothetical protein
MSTTSRSGFASSPITRSVPLPTAVVNGERRFSNARA